MLQKLEVVDLGVIWQKTQLPFICIFKNRLSNRDPIREQEERKYSVKNVQKFYVTLNIFLQLLYHPFQYQRIWTPGALRNGEKHPFNLLVGLRVVGGGIF